MKRLPYIVLLLSLVACEPSTKCHQDLLARMQVTLHADSLDQNFNTCTYTSWENISVQGVGSDSIILDDAHNVSSFSAELRPTDSITAFLLTYHEQTDTLYIYHTPRLTYVSLACGCAIYHTLLAAYSTDPRVDSVQIINAAVEAVEQENLRIYLHE